MMTGGDTWKVEYEPVILDGVLPSGTYKVVAASVEERTSNASGNKYTAVTAVVIEGEHAGHVIYQFLLDREVARDVWKHVVPSPRHVQVGLVYLLDVNDITYMGQRRSSGSMMHRVEKTP